MRKNNLLILGLISLSCLITGCQNNKNDSNSINSSTTSVTSQNDTSSISEDSILTTSEESTSMEHSIMHASIGKYSGVEDQPWAGTFLGFTSHYSDGDIPANEATLVLHSDGTGYFECGEYKIPVTVVDASKFTNTNENDREIFLTDEFSNQEWSLLYKPEDMEWAGSCCGFFPARYEFIPSVK